MNRWLLFSMVFVAALPARAAEDPDDVQRTRQLQFLKDRFATMTLTLNGSDSTLKTTANPVLRYTNPVRSSTSDGTIFLWLDGQRPLAICAYSVRHITPPPTVNFEFSSLVNQPLQCLRHGKMIWQPGRGGLCDQAVPDAPIPSVKPTQRLVEMRAIARRFEAEFLKENTRTQLRLLTQPTYRFQAPEQGTLDGGLFAFVEANDPEMMLMLEARTAGKDGGAQWRYTLARVSSLEMSVRLDGKEVFAPPNYWRNPRTLADPYIEAFDGEFRVEDLPPLATSR